MEKKLLLYLSTAIIIIGMSVLPFFSFALLFPGEAMPLKEVIPITTLVIAAWIVFIYHVILKHIPTRKVLAASALSALPSVFYSAITLNELFRWFDHEYVTRIMPSICLAAALNILSLGVNFFCMVVVLRRNKTTGPVQ